MWFLSAENGLLFLKTLIVKTLSVSTKGKENKLISTKGVFSPSTDVLAIFSRDSNSRERNPNIKPKINDPLSPRKIFFSENMLKYINGSRLPIQDMQISNLKELPVL